jgi:acetylornithine deacetylase/succinyl-diaminopimelate desuccinylase-like protein
MATAIHRFDESAQKLVSRGPRTTYNIGKLGGGTSVNAVPFESWAEVDLRSETPRRLDQIDGLLRRSWFEAVERHNVRRERGTALKLMITAIGERPSGTVAPETALVQRALAAARYVGIEPLLGSGSTDANVAIARGIAATTISRGGKSGGAHSLQEWWSNEDVVQGTHKALLTLLASTGLAAETDARSD